MKSKEMRAWLNAHASVMEHACNASAAKDLRRLLPLLDARDDASVKDICKALDRAVPTTANEGPKIAAIDEVLKLMIACAIDVASASVQRELSLFGETLHKHQDIALDALVVAAADILGGPPRRAATPAMALNDTEIRAYVRRLEEALGDEKGFGEEYARLTADARIKVSEAKKIAKAFVGKAGQNKREALSLILARQSSLIGARAKANATGGRSAA